MRLGKSTVPDSSPSGNDGECYGTLYVPGVFGSALEFHPLSKGYVNVPHDATLNFGTGDFSLCLWLEKNFWVSKNEVIINKACFAISHDGYGLFLRENGEIWFSDDRRNVPVMRHSILNTLYGYSEFVDEPTNPVLTPTPGWEGSYLAESNVFKVDGEYRMWYRGATEGVWGSAYIGYATSVDGVSWTRDPGNPLSFEPTIPDGYSIYPSVVRDGDNFYMFVVYFGCSNVYLFNVTDPTNPVAMNNGNPVLIDSQPWELGLIYNIGVAIVNGVWHMLYEAGAGNLPPYFCIGYTYSTLTELNWTAHKSALNPVISTAGNPELKYVPERNALLAVHCGLVTPAATKWCLLSSYASLTSDLNLPASWVRGQLVRDSIIDEADASILFGYNDTYNMLLASTVEQKDIAQKYADVTLTEFYDALTTSQPSKRTVFLCSTRESGVVKLYIDNVLKETTAWTGNVTSTQPLVFGKHSYTSPDDQCLNGIIDDARIYNQALSLAEIDLLYNSEPAVFLNRDYVLCLPLNEGSGTDAYDRSRYGNDGSITGASWVDGKYGKALSFDGATAYVDCGTGASLNLLDAKTISFWIKTTQDTQAALIDKVNPESHYQGYGVYLNRTDVGKIDVYCGESLGWTTLSSSIPLNDGEWHFITLFTKAPTGYLYVDGSWVQNFDYSATTDNSAIPLHIGVSANGSHSFFNGILDEVCIDQYGMVWTAVDPAALYNGKVINADCMLYFPFTGIIYEDDDPDAQEYSDFWRQLLSAQKQNFGADSVNVTRHALRLHGRDHITGQMAREYEDMSVISMVVLNKNSARTAYTAGYYVRLDAVGITGDVVRVDDKIELLDGTFYRVASVQPQRAGNTILLWTCDLEELPFKEV